MLGQHGWEKQEKIRLPWTKYIPIVPTAKQLAFVLLNSEEAFYGGAAGGGKSIALIMAALQYVETSGYSAIIFRKKYVDLSLPHALMFVANEWLRPSDARWNDKSRSWVFPAGATLTFGYLDNENDHFDYQSAAFQFIGFDELTQFREADYTYLFSRLRRLETSDIPLRVRAASNPGGYGHDWVKQRFITEGREKGRPFIPAKLEDNPYLDRESYLHSLSNLDPITREQLLNGDWSARKAGSIFKREWFKIIEARPAAARWVRFWDLAATEEKKGNDPDWTAGCLMGKTPEGLLIIADMRHIRGSPATVETLIKQTAQLDGAGVPVYIEQEPGASGKNTIAQYRKVLEGFTVQAVRPLGEKVMRAGPLSSQAEGGNVKLVNGIWIGDFLSEIESFPGGPHDDQVDAASGAYGQLLGGLRWGPA